MATVILQTLRGTVWTIPKPPANVPQPWGAPAATRHDGLMVEYAGFSDGSHVYRCKPLNWDTMLLSRTVFLEQVLDIIDQRSPPVERRFQCNGCNRPFTRALGDAVQLVMGQHNVHPACCDGCRITIAAAQLAKAADLKALP